MPPLTPTAAITEVAKLGARQGFRVAKEHTLTGMAIGDYRPRLDVVWGCDLADYGYDPTALELFEPAGTGPYGLVGIEVEVTQPTTKRHFTNLANIALAGTPFALLVVAGEEDGYRRANRVIRTFNQRFGIRDAIALEFHQISAALRRLRTAPLFLPAAGEILGRGGRGGESQATRKLRSTLADVGAEAGFVVSHDAADVALASSFEVVRNLAPAALATPSHPGQTRTASKPADYFTDSRPDVTWAVRVGPGLEQVVDALAGEACFRSLHQTFGPVGELLPVAIFEIDTTSGKHAAGALFTAAARRALGVLISTDDERSAAMFRSHAAVVGTGRVTVLPAGQVQDDLQKWLGKKRR